MPAEPPGHQPRREIGAFLVPRMRAGLIEAQQLGFGRPAWRLACPKMRQQNSGAPSIGRIAGQTAAQVLFGRLALTQITAKNAQTVMGVAIVRIVPEGAVE